MNNPNRSIAQTLADNEQKSRRTAAIYLAVFILLTILNIVFAVMWGNDERKLRTQNNSLIAMGKQFDSMNTSLGNMNRTLLNIRTSDSLKELQYKAALERASPRVAQELNGNNNSSVVVYLQYIDSYKGAADSVAQLLGPRFRIPGLERMRRANFGSCVKYFRPEDAGIAKEIAISIGHSVPRFARSPLRVWQQNMHAPAGQIEVWLGEVQKDAAETLLDNAIKQQ